MHSARFGPHKPERASPVNLLSWALISQGTLFCSVHFLIQILPSTYKGVAKGVVDSEVKKNFSEGLLRPRFRLFIRRVA